MTYYSTTENKVIGKTNNSNGYDYPYPKIFKLFDDSMVYYASKYFDPEDPTKILGSCDSNIMFAKYGYSFTNTAIYNICTNEKLQDHE